MSRLLFWFMWDAFVCLSVVYAVPMPSMGYWSLLVWSFALISSGLLPIFFRDGLVVDGWVPRGCRAAGRGGVAWSTARGPRSIGPEDSSGCHLTASIEFSLTVPRLFLQQTSRLFCRQLPVSGD